MSSVAMSSNDTIVLDGTRVLNNLATGSPVEVTFPDDLAKGKVGKNGNTIFAFNETGKMCNVKLIVLLGSDDDKYLNGRIISQNSNFAGTVLAFGSYTKNVGDGKGNITPVTYSFDSGIYKKIPGAKTNAEGDVEQSTAAYEIDYYNSQVPSVRSIG